MHAGELAGLPFTKMNGERIDNIAGRSWYFEGMLNSLLRFYVKILSRTSNTAQTAVVGPAIHK